MDPVTINFILFFGAGIILTALFFSTKKATKNISCSKDIVTLIETRKSIDEEIDRQICSMGKIAKWRLEKALRKKGLIPP